MNIKAIILVVSLLGGMLSSVAQTSNTFPAQGSVGIGTTTPKAVLDVARYIPGGQLGTVLGRLPEGDWVDEGTFLGVRGFVTQFTNAYHGKSFALEHSFYGKVNSSINFMRGGSYTGGFITFNTFDNTEKMRLDENGNLMLGTTVHNGYKLSVAGKIRAHEIKVETSNWPDYVFNADYNLRPLAEVAQFIKANGHLPEVPKAADAEADGVSLGEMNRLLLKKVEELTLYIIDLKQIVSQQQLAIDRLGGYNTKEMKNVSGDLKGNGNLQ